MQPLEAILRAEIGLDVASMGTSVIERVLRLRMKHHGFKQAEDYCKLVRRCPEEMNALIEAVVVTETWFMRGRESFDTFAAMATNEWLPRNYAGIMRVLSVPCSSGEEPYSLAMTLVGAGFPQGRFTIDAVDVSEAALNRAQFAIYGKNSFRGKHLEFRDRFFVEVEGGYALNPDIQCLVSFRRDNLLRAGFNADGRLYDFILCRNLLIYFDRETQIAALKKIRSMLASDGVLFVGPAEMPLASENGFASANIPLAFAARKQASVVSAAESPKFLVVGGLRPAKHSRGILKNKFQTDALGVPVDGVADHAESSLIIARQLADAGQLADAAALCEKHIKADATSAEGHYLMGLVKDAEDDSDAIVFYRKAIYLDPKHYEALIHASLWLEKNGDTTRADAFKRRAERVLSEQD